MSQPNPIRIQKSLSGVDCPVSERQLPDRECNGPNAVSEEVSEA